MKEFPSVPVPALLLPDSLHSIGITCPGTGALHLISDFPFIPFSIEPHYNQTNIRRREWLDAVQRNLFSPFVAKVHLLHADTPSLQESLRASLADPCQKLQLHSFPRLGDNVLYNDLFQFANDNLKGEIVMIHNSDIYLGHGWEKLTRRHFHPRRAYALTRWPGNCALPERQSCQSHGGSHDSFVFISPAEFNLSQVAHRQNLPGAENIVHLRLVQAGYTLSNPCLDLITVHGHCSGQRVYKESERINWTPELKKLIHLQYSSSGFLPGL